MVRPANIVFRYGHCLCHLCRRFAIIMCIGIIWKGETTRTYHFSTIGSEWMKCRVLKLLPLLFLLM